VPVDRRHADRRRGRRHLGAFRLTIGLFLVAGVASSVLGTLLMIFVFAAIAMPELGITFRCAEEIGVSSFIFRGSLALSPYTCTFVAEAIRSGINAVPLGQGVQHRYVGERKPIEVPMVADTQLL
jgi:glutamate transport system permease protein